MIKRVKWRSLTWELVMVLIALVFVAPFYILVAVSLKPSSEVFTTNPLVPSLTPDFGNFVSVFTADAGGAGMGAALVSSVVITVTSVVILILLGSLCAYALARRPGRLSNGLYLLFVIGIIVPFQLSIIPLYAVFRPLGLIGTYGGMIILWVGVMMPLVVFLYTGFVRTLPKDYEEAARIDGAGPIRTYWSIVFPLMRPVTGTVAILAGLFIWNDFFSSLIFLGGSRVQTLPVAIYGFVGQYVSQWNFVFAAVIIAILPIAIFFIIAQRQFIKGFAGGIRG